MKSFYPFEALLVAGLLAAPNLITNTKAVNYIDETWRPADTLTNANGKPYAFWNDPNNLSGGGCPYIKIP